MFRTALAIGFAVFLASAPTVVWADPCTSLVTITPVADYGCDSVQVEISTGGAITYCCPTTFICSIATTATYYIYPCPPSVPCSGAYFTATTNGQPLVVTLDGHTFYTVYIQYSGDITYRCDGAFCFCALHRTCTLGQGAGTYRHCAAVNVEQTTWSNVKFLMR